LGFGICPSFKDHSLSRRAKTLALRFATFASLYAPPSPNPATLCLCSTLHVRWGVPVQLAEHSTHANCSALLAAGMDTAKRLVMPKYYNDSREMMVAALAEIKSLHCDFLVGGRLSGDGVFEELDGEMDGLEVPSGLEGLFQVPTRPLNSLFKFRITPISGFN
jgi:hypothetical protein